MIYVPALRYRQEEREAIHTVHYSGKIVPLIEIVSETPRATGKGNFQSTYQKDFSRFGSPFMVDFPLYLPLGRSTKDNISTFLIRLKRSRNEVISRFEKLASIPYLIPVLSYNPDVPYISGTLTQEAGLLRQKGFSSLAYRVFPSNFNDITREIPVVARPDETLIFDIGTAHHGNPAFGSFYNKLQTLKGTHRIKTVLLRSALSSEITNVGLQHGQPVVDIDNSLLQNYAGFYFDAFGDYVGIKKDNLLKGGTISPGLIYYFWSDNYYLGFKGRTKQLSEFAQYIVPETTNTANWHALSPQHKANCAGCQYIQSVLRGHESGKSQAMWKRVSMMHYLYTMEESL